jgi:tetratricopeptide (TPR) repeat protein
MSWPKAEQRAVFKEKIPFIVIAVIFAVLAIFAQRNAGALRAPRQYFFSYRIGQAAYGVVFYLWKSIFPTGLSPLYELPYDFAEWTTRFLVCGIIAIGITIALLLARNCWPAGLACWAYYLVVLAPVLGIAQSGPQLVADRYSYLSCASWPILIGSGFFAVRQLGQTRVSGKGVAKLYSVAILVALMTLGSMTWHQTGVWRDTRALWQHVIAVGPPSSIAYYNLGREMEDENRFADAAAYYQQAIAINPAHPDAHYNLARLLAREGKSTQAIEHYRYALVIRPNDAETHNNLGLLLALGGDFDAALTNFRRAIEVDPSYSRAFFNRGRVLARQGRLDEAAQNYQEALSLSPNETEILSGLSDVLIQQKQWNEALIYLRQLVALKPNSADAHTTLARTLAAQGDKTEAEKHYREAVRLLKSETLGAPHKDRSGHR